MNALSSIDMPDDVMSMTVDGMDQAKTRLPRQLHWSRDSAEVVLLQLAYVGAVIHGHAPGAVLWHFPADHPKDSSMTAQVILNTLKLCHEERGYLPKKLILQLDNTNRENKNKAIMAVLSMLLLVGLFPNGVSHTLLFGCFLSIFIMLT